MVVVVVSLLNGGRTLSFKGKKLSVINTPDGELVVKDPEKGILSVIQKHCWEYWRITE